LDSEDQFKAVTDLGFEAMLKKLVRLEKAYFTGNASMSGQCFRFLSKSVHDFEIFLDSQDQNLIIKSLTESEAQLQSLSIGSYTEATLGSKSVARICQKYPNLKVLSIYLDIFDFDGFSLSWIGDLKSLETLDFGEVNGAVYPIDDHLMVTILKGCPALKCLDLHSPTLITDKTLEAMSTYCSRLKCVQVTDVDFTDEGLRTLAKLKNLRIFWYSIKTQLKLTEEGVLFLLSHSSSLGHLIIWQENLVKVEAFGEKMVEFVEQEAKKNPNQRFELKIEGFLQKMRRKRKSVPNLKLSLKSKSQGHGHPDAGKFVFDKF
jgi:hypothetical protein